MSVEDFNNQLICNGYDNEELNKWKIELYNSDYHTITKYYDIDQFCHEYCIFQKCNKKEKICDCQHSEY